MSKIFNCGSFIRRKQDEIDYSPSVAILHSDGSIKRHKLNTKEDQFHVGKITRLETPLDVAGFVAELEHLAAHNLDFRGAVLQELKTMDASPAVKQIIREAIEPK